MPLTIVCGAQYGSEGKGKVALHLARTQNAIATVRVGGPNSGHTVHVDGHKHALRQLPVAGLIDEVLSVLPPGSYLDVDTLLREITELGTTPDTLAIDPRAVIVTQQHRDTETHAGLDISIGSTASGTGAAVAARVRRLGTTVRAADIPELAPYLRDTLPLLRTLSDLGQVIIEGTQGYGLSLLHGPHGDYATSRDTTAAGFLSETGLSPLDVTDVVLVARAHPIRVAGNSGPLTGETTWTEIGANIGEPDLVEHTTVTRRVRRVGTFEPDLVRRAVQANRPTMVVLNHLDYVARLNTHGGLAVAAEFLDTVAGNIGRCVDMVGTSPDTLVDAHEWATCSV